MSVTNNEELVKRIARLAKQNHELEEHIKQLEKMNEKLVRDNQKIKVLYEKISPEGLKEFGEGEKKERSLKFNMATVLFADIHGFSRLVEGMDSSSVMDELDEIILEFESIVNRLKMEKIKTIGDTYMCAGGIPVKNITNPIDVVLAAIEMRYFLETYEMKRRGENNGIWKLKIGIHSGPVTAAISGRRKINYDIKGDTVNTASRIEGVSDSGMILISVMTYELVKEFFHCEYFGKLPVKYKDDLQMYKVKGLKPEFSFNYEGVIPNESFRIKFGLIQFTDIQEIILDKLEMDLPGYLFYHNVKHTVDVVTEVELICSLIMSTKLPPKPTNLLENIMCDSDLDYLGRSDFIPVSNTLYEELKAQNKMGSLNDWNKIQVKFISGHQYFTKTARSLREVNKQLQIERIESLITE